MQITEVRASWTETANLGNYSNVKPSHSLTATLEPGEDAELAERELMRRCRTFVQAEVDEALEAEDKPAKYSTEPRFDVRMRSYHGGHLVLIVPAGTRIDKSSTHGYGRGFRLAHARRYAARQSAELSDDARPSHVVDCSDGDLAPALAAIEAADQADAVEEKRREQMRAAQEQQWREEREARERRYAELKQQQQADDEEDEEDEGDGEESDTAAFEEPQASF